MALETLQHIQAAEAEVLAKVADARREAAEAIEQAEAEATAQVAAAREKAQTEGKRRMELAQEAWQVLLERTRKTATERAEAMKTEVEERIIRAAEMVVERVVGGNGSC